MSYFIKIMNGKDKGVEYKLVSSSVLIGRAKFNDIVLNDMKVSRKHAILNIKPGTVSIKKINQENNIIVNGVNAGHAILEPNSIIQLGKTNLKLIDKSALKKTANVAGYKGVSNPKGKSKTMFYTIIVIVAGLFYLLLSGEDESTNISSTDVIEENERSLASIEEKTSEHYRALVNTKKNTIEYKEAQALFIQGFRDYREQNFVRAIDYFNGALALFPHHILAKRYLMQSRTKLDYLIQSTLSKANDYYEKRQYNRAISAYKQILILAGNRRNKTLSKEARTRLEEVQLLLRAQGDF